MSKEVWVIAANRTPIGSFQGELSSLSASELGSVAIKGALQHSGLSAEIIDEVLMGHVLLAGCGQAPARQAALKAGIPENIGCTTINKVCGSGMKSVMLGHDAILAGTDQTVVAGGMESMSNAPYLQSKIRSGLRLGHSTLHDHMFLDGLQDAYEGDLMGVYAQKVADERHYTRQSMDKWAVKSVERALIAQEQGWFDSEIIPVKVANPKGDVVVSRDEHPNEINLTKLPVLRSAFVEGGTVTAGNSSSISDGAAALVLMEGSLARQQGHKPLAIISAHSCHARQPAEFTVAPVYAIRQLLDKLAWSPEQVDSWEINEAFAVVTQIATKELGIDPERVNPDGGACALGHPIGASGARIIVTLIHRLNRLHQSIGRPVRGIAACCIGGGEATAIAIEVGTTE
ncbi:thiolase family protein [Photobacterium sp. DNB23_23_1]|uniref:Thiolase family protein n=1 Tax=Photobacterium pectinilyticum TaxID=2906793 RepID=A0ABT1N4F7_9GAMM|nr:thiolase family protein [Photobacterium sp. ZSDE20]MCQ1059631.1 thiolase family protein [Photobacterium sp. ZSDE20]MDD1827613.1 thiolase family protein [Photobacterium sp. ZSDE20]